MASNPPVIHSSAFPVGRGVPAEPLRNAPYRPVTPCNSQKNKKIPAKVLRLGFTLQRVRSVVAQAARLLYRMLPACLCPPHSECRSPHRIGKYSQIKVNTGFRKKVQKTYVVKVILLCALRSGSVPSVCSVVNPTSFFRLIQACSELFRLNFYRVPSELVPFSLSLWASVKRQVCSLSALFGANQRCSAILSNPAFYEQRRISELRTVNCELSTLNHELVT
jgi:hypothetical protein